MAELIAYAIMFAGLILLAFVSGNRGAVLSACILSGVWVVWCMSVKVTGDYEPWPVGIFLDGLAAYILTMPGRHRRGRVVIASLYAMQIAAHTAYGWQVVSMAVAPYEMYGSVLDALAWMQIIGVGAWAGGDILHIRGGRAVSNIAAYRRGDRRG